MKIAVSGKGGVGKTTFSALLIRSFNEQGKHVLAIDADPDANLAAALGIDTFAADFFSIGSNDLVQYTMAAGRDCAGVAGLQNPLHPAVLELIRRVADHAGRANRPFASPR